MAYLGQGKLIGYRTYKDKNGAQKHIYNVLNGTIDTATGLYDDCELANIFQAEQTLKTLKPQEVSFDVIPKTFNGQTRNTYTNIHATEGKK